LIHQHPFASVNDCELFLTVILYKSYGYKANATTVDKAKHPKYAAGQVCSNCTLHKGKTVFATSCSLFGAILLSIP
jgi:hypothetical protein